MKFLKSIVPVAVVAGFFFTSCRENPQKETTIIRETKVVTPAVEEDKGLFEKVGDAVDDRVNNEVNEEINDIRN